MEFIASLKRSRASEGLTAEKLKRLERIFRDAVGDKQEIDIKHFKKIVQSKNMFFVERIFYIFDVDKSGSVSFEEFMRFMRCFAKQSPRERLRYLFDVYDLNNDGIIQFSELRNVISECMKENCLKFQDSEIDELTKMLFEDADTDGSGSINFEKFRNQLEKYPAFMENLTLSLERWLIPLGPPKRRGLLDIFTGRTVIWKRIKNNWTSVTFLLIYFSINFILFISKAYEYRDSNTCVIIARACGQCLNFNCAFIVVLILRQTLTWLRTHGFSQYFPIDQHIYYHKLTGCLILFFSYLHTLMHIINFAILSVEKDVSLHELLISTYFDIGWVGGAASLTGWLLLMVLTIMIISAMPFVRKSGKFEVFYYLHLLSFLFWIILIMHGRSFWQWFLGPCVLLIIEIAIRINRNLSSSKRAYVQQGVLLPSKVTHLVIKRPPKFDYRPGDYVYINIPAIAKFEWHPFTISSAPELDDVIWLHIRGVGEWTNSLYSYFERADKEAVLSDELTKDLELASTFKNDGNDELSVHANYSSLVPSIMGDGIILTGYINRAFEDSPLQINTTLDNNDPDTVIEVRNYESDNKNSTLDSNYTLPPQNKNASSKRPTDIETDNKLQDHIGDKTEISLHAMPLHAPLRRTSFSSTATSRLIQEKNKEDLRIIFEQSRNSLTVEDATYRHIRKPYSKSSKEKRRSVRVSIAKKGLRRCQTVIIMPTFPENEDENVAKPDLTNTTLKAEEEMKDLKREAEVENVVLTQHPLKIFLDGPYGSPTRHIFQAGHAVLIGTGIGVTPFASILQSIMYQYRKSRHTCPSCNNKWSDPIPVSTIHLKKVDFFWLNRHQRAFEWFVNLLSELEIEQAQLEEEDRFLDIHMYITSALNSSDMKAVGLQMALDLLYQKEKRCLITGLKSRTQPGRPDWNKVFTSIAQQQKGKVTVFFCGPTPLAKTLRMKCDEFGFNFRKETF